MDDTQMTELLRSARTIAVVGLSANPARASNAVAAYLARNGYELVGVNPSVSGPVDGIPMVADLAELTEPPDIVDVFRRPEHTPEVAKAAVAIGAKAVWLQLGIRSAEAAAIVADAGLPYVEDRCIKIDHARLLGR